MSHQNTHVYRSQIALIIGYVSLLCATTVAYENPATGYELSIYTGTPITFWVGIGISLFASLIVAMNRTRVAVLRDAALLLGGTSLLSIVLLPLIRGYHQYGSGDSLTHLGWTHDIVSGQLSPLNLLYPGIHTMTIFASRMLEVGFAHSQILVVGAFVALFFLFVPMCADLLGGRKWSLPIGAFSAFLLLPNNNIGTYLMAHPITQSLLLMPLILYLVALYISEKEGFGGKLTVITPIGILLSLALVSLIFIHPQGALNILAILLTISGIQFISKQFSTGTNIASYRTLYGPSAVLLGAFSLWAPRFPRVSSMVDKVLTIISEGSLPGGDITQRSGSLDALGADITELFLKMFFVPTIFCLIAGIFIVAWYFDLFDKRYSIRKTLLAYIIVSLAPLSIAFGIFFASSLSIQYFRYMGFIMVPITIIGAIAISMSAERLRPKFDDTKIAIGLVILFLVLFPLPIATMHGSPFIYQPNGGVSEMELSGTEHTVNYMEEDTPFTGVRRGPRRQLDATQGTVGAEQLGISGERVAIPPAVFGSNMTTHYDSPRYIPVSEADYQREVVLYDGFRYSKDGFRQLRTGTGINRVHTNGEYQLYLLDNQTRP